MVKKNSFSIDNLPILNPFQFISLVSESLVSMGYNSVSDSDDIL